MFVQVTALCERTIALSTNIRTLASMQAKMRLQVTTLSKAAVARLTDKWTFARVNTLMSLEI